MSEAKKKGENNPTFGTNRSEEVKRKISATRGTAIEVFDIETYDEIRQAAKELHSNKDTIRNIIQNTKLIKARYKIEIKYPIFNFYK